MDAFAIASKSSRSAAGSAVISTFSATMLTESRRTSLTAPSAATSASSCTSTRPSFGSRSGGTSTGAWRTISSGVRGAAPSGACGRRAIGGAATVTAAAPLRHADATVTQARKRAADMTTSGLIVTALVGGRVAHPHAGGWAKARA